MTDAIAAAAIMLPLLAIGTALLATGRRHDRIVAAAAEAERLSPPAPSAETDPYAQTGNGSAAPAMPATTHTPNRTSSNGAGNGPPTGHTLRTLRPSTLDRHRITTTRPTRVQGVPSTAASAVRATTAHPRPVRVRFSPAGGICPSTPLCSSLPGIRGRFRAIAVNRFMWDHVGVRRLMWDHVRSRHVIHTPIYP